MIFIVNCNSSLIYGHNWVVDKYLRRAFREMDTNYVYINQNADIAKLQDNILTGSKFEYMNSSGLTDSIAFIRNSPRKNVEERDIIFLTWIAQFSTLEMSRISKLSEEISARIVGISLPTSEALLEQRDGLRYVHQEFFSAESSNTLLVGDDSAKTESGYSVVQLPEFAEVETFSEVEQTYDLSFFGQLSAYRGLAEVLLIALFNPKLRIRIQGYSFSAHRVFRPYRFRIFRYRNWKTNPLLAVTFSVVSVFISFLRFLPNVTFCNQPFSSENELDRAMRGTKAIYYGAKYPHGSGIVTKCQSAGIPVLWTGWEGRAFNVLRVYSAKGYLSTKDIFIPNRVRFRVVHLSPNRSMKDDLWNEFLLKLRSIF